MSAEKKNEFVEPKTVEDIRLDEKEGNKLKEAKGWIGLKKDQETGKYFFKVNLKANFREKKF